MEPKGIVFYDNLYDHGPETIVGGVWVDGRQHSSQHHFYACSLGDGKVEGLYVQGDKGDVGMTGEVQAFYPLHNLLGVLYQGWDVV